MKTSSYVVAIVSAIALGWFAGVLSAEPSANVVRSPVSLQASPAPVSMQTIRLEPVDATHVRLRLEGRENWVVDSAGFSLVSNLDFLRVVAASGKNAVTVPGSSTTAETFELRILRSGSLGFSMTK